MSNIRTLIVDDEPLARDGLRELLENEADIEIVGECADGVQAIEEIQATSPELILLDVQMPEVDGFDVLEAIGADKMPAVIFVTAFNEYALRAFDVHALDYVLKPLDPERFKMAISRARDYLRVRDNGNLSKKLFALLQDLKATQKYVDRFMVKSTGRIYFLRSDEVDWIEADGDYVHLHVQGKKHIVREKIGELEKKLSPQRFARIHRSRIVNIDRIKELQPHFYGEYIVTLKDGSKLTLSRTYREKLLKFLSQPSNS